MRFLIIDFNRDNAGLLAFSIKRKFPACIVDLATDSDDGLSLLRRRKYDGVVVHRTYEMDADTLIENIRDIDRDGVVIAVSGVDRGEDVLTKGATGFLHYDEWLRIGNVLENAIRSVQRTGNGPL